MEWIEFIEEEKKKAYFKELSRFLLEEEKKFEIYPPSNLRFNAFKVTPYIDTKVVIIGQDPYHGEGQAQGLSFSVPSDMKLPPSLKNIYKEIEDDIDKPMPKSGDLSRWAKQGVLLLNTVLSVRKSEAGSHQKKGWETFTDQVVSKLNEHPDSLVFMLWGAPAQKKGKSLDKSKHLILEAPHPSPLSSYRGFFGCKHFSKANEFLKKTGRKPINW